MMGAVLGRRGRRVIMVRSRVKSTQLMIWIKNRGVVRCVVEDIEECPCVKSDPKAEARVNDESIQLTTSEGWQSHA